MHISCPHCNAAYNVGPLIKNAVLVCHRCHTEFNMGDEARKQQEQQDAAASGSSLPLFDKLNDDQKPPTDTTDPESVERISEEESRAERLNPTPSIPVPAFLIGEEEYAKEVKEFIEPASTLEETDQANVESSDNSAADSENTKDETIDLQELNETAQDESIETASEETSEETSEVATDTEAEMNNEVMAVSEPLTSAPPVRKEMSIWPWLIIILLIISGTGFWYKQDLWLDHPWVRSVLINLHLPVTVRDKDWVIVPESVQGNWLKRDDGSQVLLIQGRIENRLYCDLAPPKILVRFFDESGITDSLEERVMPITEPPSMEKVKHAPFVTPDLDKVEIEAQGQRGFFLVLESLPEQAADFTLNPLAN